MVKLSVTMIAKNEAEHIAAALESAAWADEIIVVDSESTDDTVAIARRFTDRVLVRKWAGYIDQKNYAASIASHDWILSLDADERITPSLRDEIRSRLTAEPPHRAYRMPRTTRHLGRWIRTTDWYPDHQLRLYDRRRARWTGQYVHEAVTVDGGVGDLQGSLEHYPYRDLADHLETIDRYAGYSARQMHDAGRRAGWVQLALHPPMAFVRNYVLRRGVLGGTRGLIISIMNAYYVFLKFAKLWELQQGETGADPSAAKPQSPVPSPKSPPQPPA